MRAALVVLVCLAAPAAGSERWVFPDEDDPKLARAEVHATSWRPHHDVPRFKLGYRRLWVAAPEGGDQPFDSIALDFYPVSRFVRFGAQGEVGIGGGNYGLWYAVTGAALGLQWPARVTPFVEGRFVAGLVGGSFMGQSVVSWIYQGGLETGVEAYYASRFYISIAVGWVHPVYGGVDVAMLRQDVIVRKDFATDSVTFKVGLGL